MSGDAECYAVLVVSEAADYCESAISFCDDCVCVVCDLEPMVEVDF